jgi:hypothetical protein
MLSASPAGTEGGVELLQGQRELVSVADLKEGTVGCMLHGCRPDPDPHVGSCWAGGEKPRYPIRTIVMGSKERPTHPMMLIVVQLLFAA